MEIKRKNLNNKKYNSHTDLFSIISVNMHCTSIYNKIDDIKCLIKKYKPKV